MRDGKMTGEWHVVNKRLRIPFPPERVMEMYETGQPIDTSRNIALTKALQTHCKYTLFYDVDTIPPLDGLEKLLSLRMPVVAGLYRSRGPPHVLLANKDGKPLPDDVLKADNGIAEVDEIGAGFMLVDMRAIKRYAAKLDNWQCLNDHKDKGVPSGVARFDDKTAIALNYKCQYCQGALLAQFFEYRAGRTSTLAISEDYFFQRNIKRLCGFKTFAFTGVRCTHENAFTHVTCDEPVLKTSLTSAANVK